MLVTRGSSDETEKFNSKLCLRVTVVEDYHVYERNKNSRAQWVNGISSAVLSLSVRYASFILCLRYA